MGSPVPQAIVLLYAIMSHDPMPFLLIPKLKNEVQIPDIKYTAAAT